MIVNFRVTQVESKIYVDPEEVKRQKNVNINYDINLKNTAIVPKQTPFGEKTILRVEYAFSYSDEDDLNQIKSDWDAGKAPSNVQNQIANTMVSNLAPLAVTLSSKLGLPPAMPLPAINFQQKQAGKPEKVETMYHG